MSLLFEALKVEDGRISNIDFHNLRFNKARLEYLGLKNELDLLDIIEIPEDVQEGLFKCRVVYNTEIKKIEFIPYEFREVMSLKLVEKDDADYTYKYADRSWISEIFKKKGECDDVLIVKDGYITDTSSANIVFSDGDDWYTPDTFLMNGTQRQLLISKGLISECPITDRDIHDFKIARMLNAFLNLEIGNDISTGDINW